MEHQNSIARPWLCAAIIQSYTTGYSLGILSLYYSYGSIDLNSERLGFDPLHAETASPPESEACTDEELFAAGARLSDDELAPFCGPGYYGLRDFSCPTSYNILQPAFERGIALGLLVMHTRRWLDSLAYFNYHRPILVDPLDMAIPPDASPTPSFPTRHGSWHHSTTVSASRARTSTSAKPAVAKSSATAADLIDLSDSPPLDPSPAPLSGRMVNSCLLRGPLVTVHEIADTESSHDGSQYGDGDIGDSDQLNKVDLPVSAKAAGKRRARFEEEKCGYVLVGSRVKQAAHSVECAALLNPEWVPKLAKKGTVSALDDDELNHLAFLLEECVWEITGPHLLLPPHNLTAKPTVTPNGYFLSLSNPKYVAGLERYHIQPAHFGALSYFVRGQDINIEFFLYQQARAAQRDLFSVATRGVIAIPEVNEKGERVFSIAPLSDDGDSKATKHVARPLRPKRVSSTPPVGENEASPLSFPWLAHQDSPMPTVRLPAASKPPSPQRSSPARAALIGLPD
ncbi:hypothetical protein C8J57DRAFT_1233808 [Mycena rebaudengoi]|nr:hypothetical protein C8J57DRAFT_1233808 [Mycena rebaudengoi]